MILQLTDECKLACMTNTTLRGCD